MKIWAFIKLMDIESFIVPTTNIKLCEVIIYYRSSTCSRTVVTEFPFSLSLCHTLSLLIYGKHDIKGTLG